MTLRQTIFLFAVLLAGISTARAAESRDTISARRAFIEMPAGVLDLMATNERLNMLDYYDAETPYTGTNRLNGEARLDNVAEDFLEVTITPVSKLQIRILPMKNGGRIAAANYVVGANGETQESTLYFFDSDMNPLPAEKILTAPRLKDFFDTKGYKTSMKEIEAMIPYYTVVYEFNPSTTDITARLTLQEILPIEDMKILELFMKPGLTMQWNGKNYKTK